MLTTQDKIKISLFGWVKGKDGLSLTERTLKRAVHRNDLKTLRYLKRRNVSETLSDGKHILTQATLHAARQMIEIGYGSSLTPDAKRELMLGLLKSDRNAFVDLQTIPFCRRLGISMIEKDDSGQHILLRGQTSESIQNWARQVHRFHVMEEFFIALKRDNVDMMKILNRAIKIDFEARIDGKTPIFWAIAEGREHAAIWLLKQRVKMDMTDPNNRAALETENGKKMGPKLLLTAVQHNLNEAVQSLLDGGIKPNNPDLMRLAAENNNEAILQSLHQKGASALPAQSDYQNRLDNLDMQNPHDQKEAEKIQTTLALLHRYTDGRQ